MSKFLFKLLKISHILIALSQLLLVQHSFCQENKVGEIIGKLNEIVQKGLDSTEKFNELPSSDSTVIAKISRIKVSTKDVFDDSTYFAAQREALRKETFLTFTSQFIQNFNPTQADVDDNILYQRRVRSQLKWQILNGGFLDARDQMKLLELEKAFMNEARRFSYKRVNFPTKMNSTIYIFNAKKNKLLEERRALLDSQRVQMERLYFLRKITKEHMLKLQTKIAETRALTEIYGTYNDYKLLYLDSGLLTKDLPLFDVNYTTVMQQTGDYDTLKQKMLAELEKQNTWFKRVKLHTFVRHSFYDLITTNPATRSFFSAGVGVALPITFNSKDIARAEKQKMLKRFDDLEKESLNNKIDLLNEVYEYRYHLKQFVIFYQKRQLVIEKLRIERVKKKLQDADYNPLNALNAIDQLYQIEIELLDIKQNLYIRLLKIHEKALLIPIEKLIVPFDLPNFDDLETRVDRAIYIWSKTVQNNSVEFLSEFIHYNNFNEVMLAVSHGEDSVQQKKNSLIDVLFSKGVSVAAMFGQNKLLEEKNPKAYMLDILEEIPLHEVSTLHLDVEPHALKTWDTQKSQLKQRYLKLLDAAKSICETYNLKLSIDLPLHLDDTIYIQKIAKKVDEIRLMCYENIKLSYLVRKAKVFSKYGTPVSLSIRTEDFESRPAMKNFAETLAKESGIERINFHDLGRLIHLDQKPLKSNEKP